MQLVAGGPDIPDALLQAHEEGRVVFFCGAGISYAAGLPSFQGLVDAIYDLVGTSRRPIEQDAYDRRQFDATLDLLERRLPGQRRAVREALVKALLPKLRRKGATDTHTALLQLAQGRDGSVRLVTTNFDRIFAKITASKVPSVEAYPAPLLPIPKNSRWNGLVYLHGLLPEVPDISSLNRLVLTSGDFGLAYLTERWAARFVSELFRNYVVCFVGYSIDDPPLRYMMDALAADRMLGEATPRAFAFCGFEPGEEGSADTEWRAKGVVPVLYRASTPTHDHSALHRTLKAWSEIYRDGILGKERIVVEYAMARPSASTQQDDFVSRMLWALSDESGLPAKRFADSDPVPPLEWLQAFSEPRYGHVDLGRFGVASLALVDDKLGFSLVRRPAPYTHTTWMTLASGGATDSRWDRVMFHLARWLVRHLDDPELILWLAQNGGRLNDQLKRQIEANLDQFARWERDGNSVELARARAQAPNAVPRPQLRTLWRLLLADRVKSPQRELDLYDWKAHLERDGLSAGLRFELRGLLAAKVVLKKPFRWFNDPEKDSTERLSRLIDWELVLAADHVHSSLRDIAGAEQWRNAMPALLSDFQQLLLDALDLLRELGGANDHSDRSMWDLPSISPHWQNRGFGDWVALIELLRDSWLIVWQEDPARAARISEAWFTLPYPTFKRLALFAASHDGCIPSDEWATWLVPDDGRWLWSLDSRRETLRLLVLQGAHLTPQAEAQLERAILLGPPIEKYWKDREAQERQDYVDSSVWLHLAKLKSSGADLGLAAAQRLDALSRVHPDWQLSANERDEFSHWMSGTGDPDFEDRLVIDRAPRKRGELVAWLKGSPPSQRPFRADTWPETCRRHPLNCAYALCDVTLEGLWLPERWREALQAWSERRRPVSSWRVVGPMVQTMSDEALMEISHSIGWWLEAVSRSLPRQEEGLFISTCCRVLELPARESVDTDEPVSQAINHPVGHITQALLNLWVKREPNDGDKLPTELEPLFTRLCDASVAQFRHGRVVLASRLVALFRVDRVWAVAHMLPLFDWAVDAAEARAVWDGFLWSPRLYRPLEIAFKRQLLETTRHYADLGEHAQQFAAFLTYAALDRADTYTAHELQEALGALPPEGVRDMAQALIQVLEGAGEQREEYWSNRIEPFWHGSWPKSRALRSQGLAESLARLSIAARGEFPAALSVVVDWLQPLEHPHFIVHLLLESGLSATFPRAALQLLDALLDERSWAPRELHECLAALSKADSSISRDRRYLRLEQYSRRGG
jgi:SIR2-like domain